jgi:hypothetical protein
VVRQEGSKVAPHNGGGVPSREMFLSGEGIEKMTRHRALAALVLTLMLALLQPASAVAAPSPDRIQAVRLTGVCPYAEGESKDVTTFLLGDRLLSPYFLLDARGVLRAVLIPRKVVASGEGLKARHLLPGEYTRGGASPRKPVTCDFAGATSDGDVNLQVAGTVVQIPRFSRPR